VSNKVFHYVSDLPCQISSFIDLELGTHGITSLESLLSIVRVKKVSQSAIKCRKARSGYAKVSIPNGYVSMS
jgi:hypothetical protein